MYLLHYKTFILALVLIFESPIHGAAFNDTQFALYKNTHFGPCFDGPYDPLPPPDTLVRNPEHGGSQVEYYPHASNISTEMFCRYFSNYTVLPTVPRKSAFHLTWVDELVHFASIVITCTTLFFSCRRIDDRHDLAATLAEDYSQDGLVSKIPLLRSRSHLDTSATEVDSPSTNAESSTLLDSPSRPSPAIRDPKSRKEKFQSLGMSTWNPIRVLRQRRERLWNLSILFWILLAYTAFSFVTWMIGFVELVRNRADAYPAAPFAFIGLLANAMSIPRDSGSKRIALVPAVLSFLQWVLTCVAMGFMNTYPDIHRHGGDWVQKTPLWSPVTVGPTHYNALSGSDDGTKFGNCTLQQLPDTLFVDPNAATMLAVPLLLFAISSAAFVGCIAAIGFNAMKGKLYIGMVIFIVGAILLVLKEVILAAILSGSHPPISWNVGCGIVHVMMDPKLGYWDVKYGEWEKRIAKAWLTFA